MEQGPNFLLLEQIKVSVLPIYSKKEPYFLTYLQWNLVMENCKPFIVVFGYFSALQSISFLAEIIQNSPETLDNKLLMAVKVNSNGETNLAKKCRCWFFKCHFSLWKQTQTKFNLSPLCWGSTRSLTSSFQTKTERNIKPLSSNNKEVKPTCKQRCKFAVSSAVYRSLHLCS